MKHLVKFILIFLLGFSVENSLAQSDWINFEKGGANGQKPEIDMYSSTDFSIDFYGANRYQRTENDTIYDVLLLPGNYGKTIDIGFPQLPVLTFNLEVTVDTPLITVNSTDYIILENFYLLPAQESETLPESDTIPPFTKNDSVYNLNEFYPNTNVQISSPSIIRGHKIISVIVYPVQHNPVTKEIKVLQSIDFSVYGAGSIEFDRDNIVFDNFLQSNVLNYIPNSITDNIVDLLILTPDIFEDDLILFEEWKEILGFRTKVVTQSELETSPPFGYQWVADPEPDEVYEGIDAFIKYAYDNWGSEAPEFILLVGETDLLPTHYQYNYYGFPLEPSDIYYTTLDLDNIPPGVNWIFDFPDIFLGRISIDTYTDLETIINKTINYEKNPQLINENFYNDILLTADFEIEMDLSYPPHSHHIERKYYTYTTETIAEYLDDLYTLNKVYTTGSPDPEEYRIGAPVDPNIIFYGEDNGYPEEEATPAIIDAINSGCFLITHRDHGFSANTTIWDPSVLHEGWLHPYFDNNNIPELLNGELFPVMLSINCQTGWFDGSTDAGQVNDHDCFGELLLNYPNGGVVGYIGSARNSISGYNDELLKGFIDAIWSDFDPFYGSEVSTPSYNLGSILNHGKFFMFNKYILTNGINYIWDTVYYKNRRTFELFHVLGDPTLEIWTGVPQPLYAYVDYTQNRVTVYDNNGQIIPEAKVVLQHGTDYIVKMTDVNGQIYSSLLNNNYDVEVSALKHNYIPWYTTKITGPQTWDANEKVRGNIIVTSGSSLTFASDITIPKYARIIVEPGASLKINNGVTVSFENGYNDILAFGNLIIQPNANMVMTLPGSGTERAKIELKNETITYSYKDVDFAKCSVKGIPFMLRLENTDFVNGSVEIEKANVEILTSDFQNSFVTIKFPRNKSGYANIKLNSTFSGTQTAIFIDGYSNYHISNCAIHDCTDGIKIFNAGGSINDRRIIENEIYNNSGIGITIYRSYTQIVMNNIYNNGYGIHSLDRSNVYIGGNNLATVPAETQQIKDNLLNEVYATNYGFPYYFKWNAVIDEDNHEPMIYYAGILGANLDVRDNYWGVNFAPATDFYPWQYFNYFPVWLLGGGSSSSGPEELYFSAQENIDQGEYVAAQSDYQQIVTEYPASLYSQAALRELWSIEEEVENDYSTLKAYYNTEPNIISTPELTKLADFLANFCDIKLENWPTAIAWFEDVIQQPETFEDSIFAIIDLGYTYWLMENSGLKSSYTGAMPQYKFGSQKDYEENRDYLLSLLPGDGLSEAMKQSLSTLKTGELLQNVPNPFKGTTEIWFKLTEESIATLTIYDYTGKEVSVINAGSLKSGNHSVEFNSANLPSGIYFYSLEVNGIKTDTKKMTLIR
jgi:hypothetical protein